MMRDLIRAVLGIRSPSLAVLGEKEPTVLDVIMRRFGYVPLKKLHKQEREHNATSEAYRRLKIEFDKLHERLRTERDQAYTNSREMANFAMRKERERSMFYARVLQEYEHNSILVERLFREARDCEGLQASYPNNLVLVACRVRGTAHTWNMIEEFTGIERPARGFLFMGNTRAIKQYLEDQPDFEDAIVSPFDENLGVHIENYS